MASSRSLSTSAKVVDEGADSEHSGDGKGKRIAFWWVAAAVLAVAFRIVYERRKSNYRWIKADVTAEDRDKLKHLLLVYTQYLNNRSWKSPAAADCQQKAAMGMLKFLCDDFLTLSNGTPSISKEAWLEHCGAAGSQDVEAASAMFDACDVGGKGELSWADYCKAAISFAVSARSGVATSSTAALAELHAALALRDMAQFKGKQPPGPYPAALASFASKFREELELYNDEFDQSLYTARSQCYLKEQGEQDDSYGIWP